MTGLTCARRKCIFFVSKIIQLSNSHSCIFPSLQ
jgi:hypothetical protein